MSTKETSTRRRFFGHTAVALSAPLAATAALAAQPSTGDGATARLAALEAANAIRALQREYARRVNAGAHAHAAALFAEPAAAPIDASVRRLAADRFATNDMIEVAPDGHTAAARFECTVETETPIAGGYTLVDMLREQGDATLRSVERRELDSFYVKHSGVWKIASLELRSA